MLCFRNCCRAISPSMVLIVLYCRFVVDFVLRIISHEPYIPMTNWRPPRHQYDNTTTLSGIVGFGVRAKKPGAQAQQKHVLAKSNYGSCCWATYARFSPSIFRARLLYNPRSVFAVCLPVGRNREARRRAQTAMSLLRVSQWEDREALATSTDCEMEHPCVVWSN